MAQPCLPAEWAPQSAVLMTWPRADGDWGKYFNDVERNFIEIARAISRFQSLIINCTSTDVLRGRLETENIDCSGIHFTGIASNDVWARDHGPITVLEGELPKVLDFRFNGWGGKYPAELDNLIPSELQKRNILNADIEGIDCVLEGGAIDSDGEGVLLTTTNCLPLPSRNPDWSLKDFENLFSAKLGIHTTHWLKHGHLAGDDTDGHVDTIARFCNPHCIVYQGCNDPQDEHFNDLRALGNELAALRKPDGTPYQLHSLPLPAAIYDDEGQRLPASYANFLIINSAVLLPVYNDPADAEAEKILSHCFPERQIITIDCRALIRQYGSLHCVTMQIPAQLEV